VKLLTRIYDSDFFNVAFQLAGCVWWAGVIVWDLGYGTWATLKAPRRDGR
jgi:hypothetical protein